jgi:hypothetical protein
MERASEAKRQPVVQQPAASLDIRAVPESANLATALSSSPPTPEQQQTFNTLKYRLHDVNFRRTHTYREFLALSVPEWNSLPQDLQNQLLAEVNGMLERGEFSPAQFLPDPEAPVPIAAAAPPPAAPSPPPTAEQLRTYESIRSKLHNTGFTQTRTLNQLAAMPELQTLTPALRQQLTNEALEMLQRGELRVRPPENQGASNQISVSPP